MSFIMVDVEADGPAPGLYSMIEVGAVVVREGLKDTFYGKLKPISQQFVPAALAVVGRTREETEKFDNPHLVMSEFESWVKKVTNGRPMFVSDNNGFDWQFVNYYFWRFHTQNPFGHSSTNMGSLYKGMVKDFRVNFKHLRQTKHTHNPVDDAMGNAEALLKMKGMGLSIQLV